ncbi:hypothetical protein SRRS_43010 [Sporomusa rhizae]
MILMEAVLLIKEELCVGCKKCMDKCPTNASIAYQVQGKNKVKVDQKRCIHCGECLEACDHGARDFADDTQLFFDELKRGTSISLFAAPSIRFNFANYKRMFGYLRSLGVRLIYDVSFGADITTWAYLKAIREQNLKSLIAQHCPTIVNYAQKFRPELIPNLAPIHSPMLCTAVYMKKYKNVNDKLAFLSPCIGKIEEINEKNTGGLVQYNVTYEKLEKYLEQNGVNLDSYPETEFDDIGCGLGQTFSRPGGLRETVEFHIKDGWIRQVGGPEHVYQYLDEYAVQLRQGENVPLLVDIQNCSRGCNVGTGINRPSTIAAADKINRLKQTAIKQQSSDTLLKQSHSLFDLFDKELNLQDFLRHYEDKSQMVSQSAGVNSK